MAHRKNIEYWLEKDLKFWTSAQLDLITADNTSYLWHLTVLNTQYEINYSDLGFITLSSLPINSSVTSEVREIYQGDTSEQSYTKMISVLADNITNCWI